jgi:hypothetical protein
MFGDHHWFITDRKFAVLIPDQSVLKPVHIIAVGEIFA